MAINIVTVKDVLAAPDENTEGAYRRGYADGYVVALNDLADLVGVVISKDLLDFWQHDLIDWVRADASKRVEPPAFEG